MNGDSDKAANPLHPTGELGQESEGENSRTRSVSHVADPDAVVDGAGTSEGGCADVRKFGKAFWLLTFCCVVV